MGGAISVGVGVGTAVGAVVGVAVPVGWVPVRVLIPGVVPGVDVSVGVGGDTVGGAGVGVDVASAVQAMLVTAAPTSRTNRNAGDMCLRYRFNPIGLIPLERLEISSRPDNSWPPSPCLGLGVLGGYYGAVPPDGGHEWRYLSVSPVLRSWVIFTLGERGR